MQKGSVKAYMVSLKKCQYTFICILSNCTEYIQYTYCGGNDNETSRNSPRFIRFLPVFRRIPGAISTEFLQKITISSSIFSGNTCFLMRKSGYQLFRNYLLLSKLLMMISICINSLKFMLIRAYSYLFKCVRIVKINLII